MKKKISLFHQLNSSTQKPICLIAGGAGFIGSFLCEELLNQGCQVICLDNLLTGRKENLTGCLNRQNFTFIKHDLTKTIPQKLPKIDYLFHLAGIEAYLDRENFSLDILKVNAAGTTNLLELARENEAKFLLTSSVDVYSAALSLSSLKNYYQGKEKHLFSHHEAKRFAESLVFEYFKKYQLNARIVRLGQVYGPRMNLEVGTQIVDLIKEALAGGPLKIPGDGQAPSEATFVIDVVEGLLRAMFTAGTNGRIFSLIDPRETTVLDLAHELQKQSPVSLSLEFVAKKEEETLLLEKEKLLVTQRYLGWTPKIDLREGIGQTLAFFSQVNKEEKRPMSERRPVHLPELRPKSSFKIAIIAGLLILFLALFPLFTLAFDIFWGANRLSQAKKALVAARFDQSVSYSQSAQKSFSQAKATVDRLSWLWGAAVFKDFGELTDDYLGIGRDLTGALYHASLTAQAGGELTAIVFQNQEGDTEKLIAQMKTELDSTYILLSRLKVKLESESDQSSLSDVFGLEKEKEALKEKLPSMRESTLQLKEAVSVLPALVARSGKRTYLILFQNNMELRPTGGFIGSFALATFEEGHFIDLEVQNVYTADGQLKGHVEPPPEIKKYLGEAGWYLRDSNFDPNFPVSAVKAEWFLEKEMGRTVDGVLAVNLDFAKKILEALGEIDLPDYQEKITAANLFERAQYHAEIGFFPGSTQKEDFLGTLARSLYVRAKDSSRSEWLGLARAVYQALVEKDLLVSLHEEEETAVISRLGWDGGIRAVDCEQVAENCLADYLLIVEANLGVNKANFFVKRSLTQQARIAADGTMEERLQIVYQNESPSENLPAGRYKNYLRVYTPKGTVLQEAKIDDQVLKTEEVKTEEIDDKTVFGFLVEVPIKEKRKVEITYQLAKKMNLAETEMSYFLLVQRQSGSNKDDFHLWLTYPPGISPSKIYPQASLGPQTIFFQPKLEQDLLFRVDFTR